VINTGQTVFTQVIARIPHWEFRRAYSACDLSMPRSNALSAWDHFLALCFAQMTFRRSLRDIEACLRAQTGLAYHMGFRSAVTRSSLARANEQRAWQPWAHVAGKLIAKARSLYQDEPRAIDWDVPVIAVDSSLIDLSLALCPWANYTGNKAALKLHAGLDLQGPIPAFVNVTTATDSDMGYLDTMPIEPGTLYVMDRGYVDFRRLRHLADHGAFFVIRARPDVPKHWPGDLRRVSIFDSEHHRRLAFWTNLWEAPAAVIAETYRQRWQIEWFFRWLKHGHNWRADPTGATAPQCDGHSLIYPALIGSRGAEKSRLAWVLCLCVSAAKAQTPSRPPTPEPASDQPRDDCPVAARP
jgi:hypothetical protein